LTNSVLIACVLLIMQVWKPAMSVMSLELQTENVIFLAKHNHCSSVQLQ